MKPSGSRFKCKKGSTASLMHNLNYELPENVVMATSLVPLSKDRSISYCGIVVKVLDWNLGDSGSNPQSAMEACWASLDQSFSLCPKLLHNHTNDCKPLWISTGDKNRVEIK